MAFVNFAEARRDPRIRNAIDEVDFEAAVRAEVDGNHTWARRAPGTTGNAGDLTLQVDVDAAITAGFAPS